MPDFAAPEPRKVVFVDGLEGEVPNGLEVEFNRGFAVVSFRFMDLEWQPLFATECWVI